MGSHMLCAVWTYVIKSQEYRRKDVLLTDKVIRLGNNVKKLAEYLPKEAVKPLEPFIILPNDCIVESQSTFEEDLLGVSHSKNINRK